MWEREAKITDAELEVMEVLWQGGDLTLAQVKEGSPPGRAGAATR